MAKKLKLVAHRGASLEYPCNSLESLVNGARMGADWVECDVRRIAGGRFVIFHDEAIEHDGARVPVGELTYGELSRDCARDGVSLMPFEFLCENYREKTPILLHIKENSDDRELIEAIDRAPFEHIWGVQSEDMLREAARRADPDHILAFMPDRSLYPRFIAGGAGVIRLWEQWLDELSPEQVRAAGARQVFVMCSTPERGMDGTEASLDKIASLGADGALLNDIRMALSWRARS